LCRNEKEKEIIMELKSKYDFLAAVDLGDTIYHINPYGYGAKIQHMVPIKEIKVASIDSKLRIFDASGKKAGHISDMINSPVKKTFTSFREAEKYLAKIHKGFAGESVQAHHYSCKR